MSTKYLCRRWQGFLEQIVNLVGHGYVYYSMTVVSSEKMDSKKYDKLDRKMINKYKLDRQTKDTMYYRRKKGLANFRYLRWENVLVVLKTEGIIITENELHEDKFNPKQIQRYQVTDMDRFTDIRVTPMKISIGEQVTFNLQLLPKKDQGMQATVKLTQQTYRNKKAEIAEYIALKHAQRVIDTFNNLNGLPAWRGIIIQKRALKKFILEECKRHGLKIPYNKLFVGASRKKEENIFIK